MPQRKEDISNQPDPKYCVNVLQCNLVGIRCLFIFESTERQIQVVPVVLVMKYIRQS